MNKAVLGIFGSPQGHWVGEGFPVRILFNYDQLGLHISPFLMLDYAAPTKFAPAPRPRGVGEHPHRGFETVTIVYQGEVAHRDSAGNSGIIGPGDVQWMTAASGVLHDEFHSPAFTQQGGALEMAQLWVNLPAKHKMSPPRYQGIVKAQIPEVALPQGCRCDSGHRGRLPGSFRTGRHFQRDECLGPAPGTPDMTLEFLDPPGAIARPLRCCAATSLRTAHGKRRTLSWCCLIAAAPEIRATWRCRRQHPADPERRAARGNPSPDMAPLS